MPKMTKLFAFSFILFLASCNNNTDTPASSAQPSGPVPDAPAAISYSVVQTFPHDTSSYTQGLVIYKGDMYEGTGNKGRSNLMKVDVQTGKALKKHALSEEYFGEGVTIVRDTVYQLTWQEHKVFVYTLPDFKKVKEYELSTDGWGLTTDGTSLIVSDGTSNLYYYDPSTFALQRTQSVIESGELVYNVNELEFIDGYIFANQYQRPYILKIDPSSGIVVGKADLTKLWDRAKGINPNVDVPNGIAYDSVSKKTYVTGKWWPELYQVEISK